MSLFGPELLLKPDLDLRPPIFRHSDLDFATIHIYRTGSIDNPRDTVRPALAMGAIVGECLREIVDHRPFLDTEHGPIHSFKDKHRTLSEGFDDEYFRHLSWAHIASGGAGGGMRWPNRHPHVLTHGMRKAQQAMAAFLPLVDWTRYRPINLNEEGRAPGFHLFACADEWQAVIWIVRRGGRSSKGMIAGGATPRTARLTLPLADGDWLLRFFDTQSGRLRGEQVARIRNGQLSVLIDEVGADLAIAAARRP